MSYLAALGLREPPFGPTADPDQLFLSEGARKALEPLASAIEAGEPLVRLTGAAGTGKTTLCRALVRRLEPQAWVTAYVSASEPDAHSLTVAVARALGVRLDGAREADSIRRALGLHLLGIARSGRRVLVVLDDAHTLAPEGLAQLRQLADLETPKRKLLQLLVSGEPSLEDALELPAAGSLQQRIAAERSVEPLARAEIAPYFDHRLRNAGYEGEPVLTPGGAKALFKASGGTPRLVNAVAHAALQIMQAENGRRLKAKHVERAAADSPALPPKVRRAERRHEWFWRSTAALLLVGVLWTAWVAYHLRPRDLVTPQAFARPVHGPLAEAREPVAPPSVSTPSEPSTPAENPTSSDPALLQSLGLPGAKIAAYSPDFALSLARLQIQRENYAGALAALDAASEDIAQRPEYFYLRGTVLRELKQEALAEEAFRRALGAAQPPRGEPAPR